MPSSGARSILDDPSQREGLTWLVVVLAGIFTGLFIVTGPLGWWFAGRIRRSAREQGVQPPQTATAAWALGIASTVMASLGCLVGGLVFAMQLGLLAAWGIGAVNMFEWFERESAQMEQAHEERVREMNEEHERRVREMHEGVRR